MIIRMRNAIVISSVFHAGMFACSVSWASSPEFDFETLADTTTATPEDSTRIFNRLSGGTIRLKDGAVYVRATAGGPNPPRSGGGYYKLKDGVLSNVFDLNSVTPSGGDGFFSAHGFFDVKADKLVFGGAIFEDGVNTPGVYKAVDGKATTVIDATMPILDSDLVLLGVEKIQTDGDNVAFEALLSNPQTGELSSAILAATLDGQNFRILVDESTSFPGQDVPAFAFDGIGGFENGRLAFYAKGGQPFDPPDKLGAYTVTLDGDIELVADWDTPLDGGESEVGFFIGVAPSITGDTVAFASVNPDGQGIYGRDLSTGEVFTYVDDETVYPELPGQTVTGVLEPSLDGDNLAFGAVGLDDRFPNFGFVSIMMMIDGEIHRVIGSGDMFLGREIEFLMITSESFEGQSVAFYARFTDGVEGVYMATLIPSPGAGAVLVSFGLLAPRRRRFAC